MPAAHHILVVDDDRGTLDTFTFVLRAADLEVVQAETQRAALDSVRRWTPDVVLCDLHLPDGSALDVLRELRHMGIDAPFIVITGFGGVTSALEAGRLGVAEYVEKPVSPEQLLRLVDTSRKAAAKRAGDAAALRGYAARVNYVIEERYSEPELSVRAVGRAVGLSTQHMCRVIKQQLGLTFADLLRSIRLREAQRLLRDHACSMKEIAFRVGFRHPSQFTRVFRLHCGVSPSQYRRQDAETPGDIAAE